MVGVPAPVTLAAGFVVFPGLVTDQAVMLTPSVAGQPRRGGARLAAAREHAAAPRAPLDETRREHRAGGYPESARTDGIGSVTSRTEVIPHLPSGVGFLRHSE
jgi:hypothetical protein